MSVLKKGKEIKFGVIPSLDYGIDLNEFLIYIPILFSGFNSLDLISPMHY
jgi:hypothetical protein